MKTDVHGAIIWERPMPTRVPCRIHYDSGHDVTSWTGELRAVVDGEQLIVRVWSARKGWRYRVEWRYLWEQGGIKAGPLPKRAKEGVT